MREKICHAELRIALIFADGDLNDLSVSFYNDAMHG